MIDWLAAGFDMGIFLAGVIIGLVLIIGACIGIGYAAMALVVFALGKAGLIK